MPQVLKFFNGTLGS